MITFPLTLLTLAATALAADPAPPKFTFLYTATLTFAPPVSIGAVPLGTRDFLTITGGTFSGPKLSGKIGTGLDWGLTPRQGVFSPDAVYTMHTDDNATVLAYERGHAPNVHVLFETASEEYAWLNTAVAYASGTQTEAGVQLDVWQLGA